MPPLGRLIPVIREDHLHLPSLLPFLPPINMSLIGVVLIARHGDREGYYQSPSRYVPLHPPGVRVLTLRPHHSYEASDTRITPLGSVQTYNSGRGLRQKYLKENAAWAGLTVEQVDFKAEYVSRLPSLDPTKADLPYVAPPKAKSSSILPIPLRKVSSRPTWQGKPSPSRTGQTLPLR